MKIIISAGDSVTAKLIKESGFDGIWVSGFEACARLGLPDNGSITMTEMLRITEPIIKATDLPVYVDVDTGYGNFARTVKEFENIGAKGLSIEDNLPLKENSLFGGKRPLLNIDEMCEKIHVENRKIEIIARTEALIRGYGYEEAISRARKYHLSGADYVLIHSRDETGLEAMELFNLEITKELPLIIVPTKFPTMTNKDFQELGYKMVIWANQTERVKIKAIREALYQLKKTGCMLGVEKELSATLQDMRGLMPSE